MQCDYCNALLPRGGITQVKPGYEDYTPQSLDFQFAWDFCNEECRKKHWNYMVAHGIVTVEQFRANYP